MKILFANFSGLVFNAETPDLHPLGGTESAMCYLARALVQRGHDVTIIGKQPTDSPEIIKGVRHQPLAVLQNPDFVVAQNFDVLIVSNAPVAGPSLRAMAPKALILFWNHLAPDHLYVSHLRHEIARDSFDGFVYVSGWQRSVTEDIFKFSKPSAIIGNGFAPAFENMFASTAELLAAKENRAAYTTTPFRGLPILLDAMNGLGTNTKLDIYSSMKVYQSTTEDNQYAALYTYAVQNPHVTYHGAVAQKELAKAMRSVAFFTYPSTYAETYCIAALEARAAGLKVLTTSTAALPEVLGNKADYVAACLEKPQELIANFRAMLRTHVEKFLQKPQEWAEEQFADLQYVNRTCSWAERAKTWEELLLTRSFR